MHAETHPLDTETGKDTSAGGESTRAGVLREFADRVDQMREDGDPSVWLPAREAVGEVIDEARRLAAEAGGVA